MTLRFLAAMFAFSTIVSGQEPLKIQEENSAMFRWLNKKIIESRVLDDMETTDHWVPFTNGAISVVDARQTAKIMESNKMVTEMSVTPVKAHGKGKSLLVKLPTKLDGPGPNSGRGWGTAGVVRKFDNEDWKKFNRISLWIYPDCPGAYQNWLEMTIFNNGIQKLPALFGQEGETTILLRNGEWNHIVWEIGNVARDKITAFQISSWMPGNEPEASDSLKYYFDDLELERVEPDYIEGWDVWPGRISFSHSGYQLGAPNSAIACNLKTNVFSVVDKESGKTVLTKPLKNISSGTGSFQLLDFSEIRKSGSYFIEAGGTITQPFRIDSSAWESTIWKALNFFYSERCGAPITGVHGTCHRDWTCLHGDKSIVINGGWHDAGDFTQGMGNTGDAVYAMFSLAEKVKARGDNPALYERLLDEARWGLDWILKTSFGDGYRNEGSINSRRTNGIIGDFDDVRSTAKNSPKTNFVASAAEAIAARVLKESDPRLAAYCLKMAEADWKFATAGMASINPSSGEIWSGSFDSGRVLHEITSAGILASVELWHATGKPDYEKWATEMAGNITGSQQRKRTDWDIPMSGFFYTSPEKDHILHYCHRGREQAPVVALTQLCEAFPDNPDWMKWYSSVVLHSQYLKNNARYTEPYGVLPASVYTDSEYLQVPETRQESFRKQVLNGIPLGKGHYLRLFPVWMDYRGHFGTILPQAQALINAARLRRDIESADLAQKQLQWIAGRNPFSQSTMYGEGYDFAPLYTPSSGDIVGALPVGIQSRNESDIPYWPVQSTWTYKEVWVHPVTQWIWLMTGLEGPAIIEGKAETSVEFRNIVTGELSSAIPDNTGRFRIKLPEGKYKVKSNGIEQSSEFLPSEIYRMDLQKKNPVSFEVSKVNSRKNEVVIMVKVTGIGEHTLTLRTDNLQVTGATKKVFIKPGDQLTLKWKCRIISPDESWVTVVVPDNEINNRKEIIGSAWEK